MARRRRNNGVPDPGKLPDERKLGKLLTLAFIEPSAEDDNDDAPWYKRAFVVRNLFSTLFGGFYFDYRSDIITNTIHFYIYLVLHYLPFALVSVRIARARGPIESALTAANRSRPRTRTSA